MEPTRSKYAFLDRARRLRHLLLQLQVNDLLLLLANQQLLPRRIDGEVAEQRLREVEVEVRRQPRVERIGRIAGRVPRAVERRLVTAAAPLERLRDSRVRSEARGGREVVAGKKVLRRTAVAVLRRIGEHHRRVVRARLRDGHRLHLRSKPFSADAEVVLERHFDRFVSRELKLGARNTRRGRLLSRRLRGWWRRWRCCLGWCRLSGCGHHAPGTEQQHRRAADRQRLQIGRYLLLETHLQISNCLNSGIRLSGNSKKRRRSRCR